MAAMLAQLKTQLKQQAAENVQLEDMLKRSDAELSSASVLSLCCEGHSVQHVTLAHEDLGVALGNNAKRMCCRAPKRDQAVER